MADNMDFLNGQADQIWKSAMAKYGGAPNPQIAANALQTGATPDVAAAINNSDPNSDNSIAALLSAGPTGSSDGSFGKPRSQANATQQNPWQYDRGAYQKAQQELMSKDSSLRNTFADINGIPIANIQYANDTIYWTGKDNKQATNWQQHLIDSGVYQHSMFGGNGRTKADGSWGDADTQALYLYLAQIGTPDALYSQNPTQQANASTSVQHFYQQIGQQWTPDGIKQAVGNNPDAQRSFQDGVFQQWLAAHPYKKDDGGALQDRLNEYMDAYGKNALPQQLQDLAGKNSGFIDKVTGIPGGILHMLDAPIQALESHLPGPLGESKDERAQLDKINASVIKQGGTIGAMTSLASTPEARSLAIEADLSKVEQAQLAPVIQKLTNGSDYATQFGNWWGHQTTKLQLATLYTSGDLFSGKDFSSNPFDNLARAWSGATAHEDNFMVGLVGQKWVDDHSTYATLLNTAASFVDPTVVVGAAGRLASVGRMSHSLEAATAISKDGQVLNGVSISAADKLKYAMAPKNTMARIRDAAMPDLLRAAKNPYDRMMILGARTPEQRKLVMDTMHSPDGKFKDNLSDSEIRQTITANFDHVLHAGATWYNFRSSLDAMSVNTLRRMNGNQLVRGMAMGAWDFGHRSMNFEEDANTAIEKMTHDARLFGMPEDQVNTLITKVLSDPTGSVDAAQEFYTALDKVIQQNHPDFNANLAAMRKTKWDGQIPDSIVHQYAVDPKGPASPTGTGELSTAPVKVPKDMQQSFDAMQNATKLIQTDLMDAVEAYQQKLGFAMGGNKEANAPLVERFLADPANKTIADKYLKDKADIEREMTDLIGSSSGERGAPMIEAQLAKLFHAPFSTWEAIVATHGKLGRVEQLQNMLRMNEIMDMWKVFTLAKPSSALRALVGDDTARVAVTLALAGAPKAAAQEAVLSKLLEQGLNTAQSVYFLFSPAAKGLFGVGDHLREVIKTAWLKRSGMSAKDAEDAAKGWYDKQKQYLGSLAPELHRLAEQTDHSGGFHSVGPGQPGHAESLPWWVRSIGAGPGREWARIYDEQGAEAAQKFLVDHRTGNQSPENLRLAVAKGATKEDAKVMQTIEWHQQQADMVQKELDRIDQQAPVFVRGKNKGQKNYDAIASKYRAAYGQWKNTHIPTGGFAPGSMGTFRQRVLDRIKFHTDAANDIPQIVIEQARHEHDFYEKFMATPELRDMVKSGQVNQKKLDALVKNPVTRPTLPWVVAMEDTARTRGFISKVTRKPADVTMEHVFRPIITAGRAEAMAGIHQWWKNYMTEFYKGSPTWDAARIQKESLGMAQDWMRHNTYQGARNIASYAMRNVFPFSGSVMNQNQFWINTFKAHPWVAGVAAKLGIKADEHSKDKVSIPNPLGWAAIGGDQLSVNPIGWSFIGSEGMGSFVPGLGPFAMPFAAIAQQNAVAKQVMDSIPGWGNYLPPDASPGSIVGGFIPSYMRKPLTSAALAAGAQASMVPGAEKAIADRTRIDEAMGQRPSEDQVRREVEIEGLQQGGASWLMPVQPKISNPTMDLIKKASAAEAKGQTIADIRKDTSFKDIAPFLEYRDPATTPQRKDQIAADYPQVIAWAAGIHETKGTSNTPKATSFSDYTDLQTSGSEHFMSAGEIDQEIQQGFQTNQFFQGFDQAYVPMRDKFLSDNQTTTSSQEYKDFKATTLDPIMQQLQGSYPLGYQKFIGGSTSLTNNNFTSAIGSLNTYFHMPTTAQLDSQGVTNWRTVTDLTSQAVANIVDAKNSGGTANDLQQIADAFQQQLESQFAGNPQFLDEIGARYHWSSWKSFLTTSANHQIAAASSNG